MSKDDLLDQLNNLAGRTKPELFKCVIAVTKDGQAFLIEGEENLEAAFDGTDLRDNLTGEDSIPKEHGVYKCTVSYHCYKSHHPLDPVEWDVDTFIVDYSKIEIPLNESGKYYS